MWLGEGGGRVAQAEADAHPEREGHGRRRDGGALVWWWQGVRRCPTRGRQAAPALHAPLAMGQLQHSAAGGSWLQVRRTLCTAASGLLRTCVVWKREPLSSSSSTFSPSSPLRASFRTYVCGMMSHH